MLTDEKEIKEPEVEDPTYEQNYIDAITKLKANSVPKEAYTKLMDENRTLINALTDGSYTAMEQVEEKPNVTDLRDKLANGHLSNLEYAKTFIALRDAVIDSTGQDPLVLSGHTYSATDADYASADRVVSVMQQCIDISGDDDGVFTREFSKRIQDTPTLDAKLNQR